MSNSLQGKSDSHLRLVSTEEAVVLSENARPTDESPTVISKTPPLVEPAPSSNQEKIVDLSRKHATPESIVASLRGRRLAHYELIEPIGVGGMAAVIRARDTQLDRIVALKILPPEMAHEPDNVERFHQEAKAAAKLDHENIARVFYCGEDQGLSFIAFEFVEGMNLRTMLDQRGRLPVAEAVRYILQIAAGLEHAATRGVVHRDVKPSNVIVTPTGRAKLVDMGLARNLERHGERDLTQSGVTLGTFDYISPEQALEPRDADVRSDIYSLGCTFYHLLTGHAPVPDGTPAKKLQHHQNDAPIDPRSIDPTIPDEIVMIVGKMLEKNPKDRYQRPIHLVHHLLQVAQKVGAVDDMPAGLLLVDAPLPSQPRSRPLVYIGLALAALIAVTVLAALVPEPVRNQSPLVSFTDKGPQKIKDVPNPIPKEKVPHPKVASDGVNTVADLQNVLADHASPIVKASLRETIDLGSAGLVIKGGADQKIIVEPDEPGDWRIIRFHHVSTEAAFGLELAGGGEIIFRRIHFRIDYDNTPLRPVAMLAVHGVKSVKFEECTFAQPNVPRSSPGPGRVPLASILIDVPEDGEHVKPVVSLDACFFEGNSQNSAQIAVAVNGPAEVKATNCAFRPHGAFFHLRDLCTLAQTSINLDKCAGFVTQGPVFRVNKLASALIRASHSGFFNPERSVVTDGRPQPGLIFLAGDIPIQYEGQENLYHNLNALVERKIDKKADEPLPLIDTLEKFQKYLAEHKGVDMKSEHSLSGLSPEPLQQANPLSRPAHDVFAFQLKAEYQQRGIGLEKTWLGTPMPTALAAAGGVKSGALVKLKKIVDAEDQSGTPGLYNNLKFALAGAKDGDVIYIRHGENSRDVVVSPVELDPGISVTLKPDTDCQPRLVLNKKFKDKETSVFKVQQGKLEIEGMEIVLDPGQEEEVTQSIVKMGGQVTCIFRACVFTLRALNKEQLSVVSSIDLESMMKPENPPAPSSAKVEFHECFVRGKGDLVTLNACRLLHVEMKNSLVALDGSLLDIEAGNKSMPMTQGVHWKMVRSSIFTTESVFALRTKMGKVLTETNADVEGCVLASLALEQSAPVVDRERDLDLGKYLIWKGEQNFYANFYNVRDWKEQYPELKSDYAKLALPKLTEKNMQFLWDATPDWFKPADAAEERLIQGFGQTADAEKRMMQPLADPDQP